MSKMLNIGSRNSHIAVYQLSNPSKSSFPRHSVHSCKLGKEEARIFLRRQTLRKFLHDFHIMQMFGLFNRWKPFWQAFKLRSLQMEANFTNCGDCVCTDLYDYEKLMKQVRSAVSTGMLMLGLSSTQVDRAKAFLHDELSAVAGSGGSLC